MKVIIYMLSVLLLLPASYGDDSVFTFDQSKQTSDDVVQQKVHIIYMNHLDVGYNGIPTVGFINNVMNKYFQEYFPRAIKVANDLAAKGYQETFIYTTHPWLVSMYLDCPPYLVLAGVKLQCPNDTQKADFVKAVQKGIITWHAGPMNMQIEHVEPQLLQFGLQLSQMLDKRFNITRSTRVLSQRDVPGMTATVIPLLVKAGITAVSVGVNNMTPPPAVPNPFVWKYGKDTVIGTWHKGGYPDNPGPDPDHPGGLSKKDCVVVPGLADVLCFAFRTDNSGPPINYTEVLGYYEILRRQFPGAQLQASTFENYISALLPMKSKLPVLDNEIADTWIQGISSDPRKSAEYRAVARVMSGCVKSGQCSYSDPRVYNASRFLLKMPEHTWGIPSAGDTGNWSNPQFNKYRNEINFRNCEASWIEQREFAYLTIDALGNHSVVPFIKQELAALKPDEPHLTGYVQLELKETTLKCSRGGMQVTIGLDGAIKYLYYFGLVWFMNETTSLGKFQYFTYNEEDFAAFGKLYNYNGHSAGYYKNNSTANAHPESREWAITAAHIYVKSDDGCNVLVHMKPVVAKTWIWYGAPQDIWVNYQVGINNEPSVDITLQIFDKTTTRLPEALFYTFTPIPKENFHWMVYKLGQLVDPMHVILNGSQHQHASDQGLLFTNGTHSMQIYSPDLPLVCPVVDNGVPTAFPAPLQPIKQPITGFSFNLYNNMWDTNYILWYPYVQGDEDFKARFKLQISGYGR